MTNNALDIELGYFDQNRIEWLKHHSKKFALIKGATVHDFYDTMDNAYEVGVELWGLVPFLVKEVLLEDRILFIQDKMIIRAIDEDQDEHSFS